MQHQRRLCRRVDFLQPLKIQMRRFLVLAVSVADGNSQRVHSGLTAEFLRGVRLCVQIKVGIFRVCGHSDMADLTFDADAQLVSPVHHLLCQRDVGVEIVHRSVHHDGLKAGLYVLHDRLIRKIMVRVQADRNCHGICQLLDRCRKTGSSCRMLDGDMLRKQHDNRRRIDFLCGKNDRPGHYIVHADERDR